MRLGDLKPALGAHKTRKRIGRGMGSGHGKTSCRGHKGQGSRSGGGVRPGFEGGQMPLARRIPKRGFTNKFKKHFQVVNLKALKVFDKKEVVDAKRLKEHGLIKKLQRPVKILGDGELSTPLTITAHSFTKSAREKIEKAGGKAELISNG